MQLKDVTSIIKEILEERDKNPLFTNTERYIPCYQPNKYGNAVRAGLRKALRIIEQAPVVDAVPVQHGKWRIHKVDAHVSTFYCSECDRTVQCGNDDFMKPTKLVSKIYPYCHCGAKMRLEEEERS